MISAIAALVLACLATAALTPAVRSFAIRSGVVDSPGGRRVHQQITPRLGGVAVIIGFYVPLAVFAFLVKTNAMRGFIEQRGLVWGLVLGSAVVGLVGGIDDVRSLGPRTKLLAQAVAAVVAYAFGYRIDAVDIPVVGTLQMGVFALPVTVFWFLAITNAINLIDGLDGLAAGIALFATVANFAMAYVNGSFVVLLLSASLAGALLGFLRYNFNPATIFLGDSGSMFLGFALAATSLAGATTKSSTAIAILAPILALGVPIMDTSLAMIRRTLAGQSIFAADRGHIHHRLLDLGITHRRVVLMLYGLSVALAFGALALAFDRSLLVGASLTSVGVVLFVFVHAVRHQKDRESTSEQHVEFDLPALERTIGDVQHRLEKARDEAAIREALAAFGDGRDVRAHWVVVSQDEWLSERDGPDVLWDAGTSGRRRYLQLRLGPLSAETSDVRELITPLVTACREALDRVARETQSGSVSHLTVAAVHASGGED